MALDVFSLCGVVLHLIVYSVMSCHFGLSPLLMTCFNPDLAGIIMVGGHCFLGCHLMNTTSADGRDFLYDFETSPAGCCKAPSSEDYRIKCFSWLLPFPVNDVVQRTCRQSIFNSRQLTLHVSATAP